MSPEYSSLRQQIRAAAAAFTFFTRIPLGRVVHHDLADLAHSAAYFPLVGLVVGAVGASVFAVAHVVWTPLLAVVVSVMATVLLTGAFHEDALADSLDGFGGGWTKEQVLAIMKDSRVGSYALIGVVLVVFAKVAAIIAIYESASLTLAPVWNVCRAMIVAHVLSRWSSVWLIRSNVYVRADAPGMKPSAGRPFVNATTNAQLAIATITSLIIVLALLRTNAIAVAMAALLLTILAGRYFNRRIGGITGDALGAANQVVELAVYLVLASHPVAGMFT